MEHSSTAECNLQAATATNTSCNPLCPSTNNPLANGSNDVGMDGDNSNSPASSSTSLILVVHQARSCSVETSRDDSNPPASSLTNQSLAIHRTRSGSPFDSPRPSSSRSLLDDSLSEKDDSTTIYSYYSTESSNYTMSNLEGPGRLLGNLFSSAGSFLERRLGKLAYSVGSWSPTDLTYNDVMSISEGDDMARAEIDLRLLNLLPMLRCKDITQKEKVCNIFLRYARYATSSFRSFVAFIN